MPTEIGEFAVGAYLREILKVDFVNYNVRPPGGGLRGLNEIDVLGMDLKKRIAYLCEVTTHIRGIQYGTYQETIARIKKKYAGLKSYAIDYLANFKPEFMLWSPVVPTGIEKALKLLDGLTLVINTDYACCINKLRERAAKDASMTDNPFYRTLQILARLKKPK